MSHTLRIDLSRRLLGGRQAAESLRGHDGAFDAVLAATLNNGEVVAGGTSSAGTSTVAWLKLGAETRAELERLLTDGAASFAEPAKDDVGRRFLLALAEQLPATASGAARRLCEEAARYCFERGSFAVERQKAAALVAALIETNLVALMRQAGEDVAADALAAMPSVPSQLGVVAAVIRDSYGPLLTGAAADFAAACAAGADAIESLFAQSADVALTQLIAEELADAFAELVAARLLDAAAAFVAVIAVEGVA